MNEFVYWNNATSDRNAKSFDFFPPPPAHNHFPHSLIFTFCSIYIYYCLHYILIPTQFIAVCVHIILNVWFLLQLFLLLAVVAVVVGVFFLGWANVCSFFSLSFRFFHSKTVLLSIWLLRCVYAHIFSPLIHSIAFARRSIFLATTMYNV